MLGYGPLASRCGIITGVGMIAMLELFGGGAAVLAAVGAAGYLVVRRRGRAGGVRRFLIWYGFMWLMVGVALLGIAYPGLGWLEFVELGIIAAAYVTHRVDGRRTRAAGTHGDGLGDRR
jgi:hypothetical protein